MAGRAGIGRFRATHSQQRDPDPAARVALWGLGPMSLAEIGVLWDWAWHRSPEQQVPLLGLPHPWILPHFLFAFGPVLLLPLLAQGRPGLGHWIGDGCRGSVREALRGSPGAALGTLGILLFVVASGLDTWRHQWPGPDPAFTAEHVAIAASSALVCLGLLLVALEIAHPRWRRWLSWAWLGLLLSAALAPFPPPGVHAWSAGAQVALALLKLAGPLALALVVGPRPLPLSAAVGPVVLLRLLTGAALTLAGYSAVAPALAALLVPAVLADGWLGLVGQRPRGWLGAGLVFGLGWGGVGYWALLTPPEVWSRLGLLHALLWGALGGTAIGLLAVLTSRVAQVLVPSRAPSPRSELPMAEHVRVTLR